MKFKISLSEDKTHLRIRVFEAINGMLEREFAENAIKEAGQHKINKFLVDVRGTPNIASTLEHYLFGYEDMNRFGLSKHSRIAILADAKDRSHDFIQTILANAGYLCLMFSDEDAVLKWFGE